MKAKTICILLSATLLLAGCSKGVEQKAVTTDSTSVQAPGDHTIYGMACDGCNDTIVIFLPTSYSGDYDGSNPDTLNILEATRNHQVFGKIHIGDKLAMMRNEQDSTVADLLIVTEEIMGKWCYKVLPKLRERADMEGQSEASRIEQLPDSIAELLTVEREHGIMIKDDHVAFPIGKMFGGKTSDELSEVEYPDVKNYRGWRLYNGRLILSIAGIDSLGNQYNMANDTAEFVKLTTDTLVLRFNDEERGYYRKTEE